jgi:hypothetical protein
MIAISVLVLAALLIMAVTFAIAWLVMASFVPGFTIGYGIAVLRERRT